ncbi:putative lipoprotein YiaD precursor [Phycisphaerae bacterium RAS1]|nr:putative lipoprotein YiaD precursor [Phycisphaerae bacterium RAS1]
MLRGKLAAAACMMTALVFSVGCQDPNEATIRALQEKVDSLTNDNQSLRDQIARAMNERDAARAREMDLADQLAAAKRGGGGPGADGWNVVGNVAWTSIAENLLFDSGKATLKSSGGGLVDQVASKIQNEFPDASRIFVVGHTDSDPIRLTKNLWKDNLDLSLNRAATVTRELYGRGIDKKKVLACGQGEHNPKQPNNSKENKQKNRRVDIVVIRGGGSEPAPATPERGSPGGADSGN